MFHLTSHARPGRLLFVDWIEGLHLWEALRTAFPEAVALCIMPDHVHLMLAHPDAARRLSAVKSGHARWLSKRRDEGALLWGPTHVEPLPDALHERRTIRYIALNPCRSSIAPDPLAWPLNLHRDHCGFGAGEAVKAPERHHLWVSGDPTVDVAGTLLPRVQHAAFDVLAVRDAVSAVLRVPADSVLCRGHARVVAIQTAWVHELRSPAHLARVFQCSERRITQVVRGLPVRGRELADPMLAACVRAVGDPRFGPLNVGDLRRTPTWGRYRSRR